MIYDENCVTCGMHAEVVKRMPDFQNQPIKYVATFSENDVFAVVALHRVEVRYVYLALLFCSLSFVYINKKKRFFNSFTYSRLVNRVQC